MDVGHEWVCCVYLQIYCGLVTLSGPLFSDHTWIFALYMRGPKHLMCFPCCYTAKCVKVSNSPSKLLVARHATVTGWPIIGDRNSFSKSPAGPSFLLAIVCPFDFPSRAKKDLTMKVRKKRMRAPASILHCQVVE